MEKRNVVKFHMKGNLETCNCNLCFVNYMAVNVHHLHGVFSWLGISKVAEKILKITNVRNAFF